MPLDSADVVVIGGGVSGLASAYFLAKAGKDVVVIEKGTVGGEASGRNGGMISERVDEPPLIPMGVESLKIWETLDDELGLSHRVHTTRQAPGRRVGRGDGRHLHGSGPRASPRCKCRSARPLGYTGHDPRDLRQDARRDVFPQWRPRQSPADGPGICMGFPGPGRQAPPEHRRHGPAGRRRQGLVGGDDRGLRSRPAWWSPPPGPRPR